ncbi:MAG: hypothetical protein IKA51_00900 [Clostridia bacterium]|nr:hypothetical protein [Clostridia bacterium]
MKKFWGYVNNGKYSIGCTGQTVYLYDKDNNEIKKYKDIIYAYSPMFSPDGKIFIVKSTNGFLAVYSLESFALIKKIRYTKFGDDNGFCFSPDGQLFINIGCGEDVLHSAIYIYNTSDFSLANRIDIDNKMMVHYIEFDKNTNTYYVLGFVRGDDGVLKNGFVARFENQQINNMLLLSKEEYTFFRSYKSLEMLGFTEKKYQWTYIDYELHKLKSMNYTLANLYAQKKAE